MSASSLRAPQEDGATLVAPDWQQLPDLLAENDRWVKSSPLRWGDQTLADLRHLALTGAQQETARWLSELAEPAKTLQRPLIVTGHQPELFHPGVWAKNIAISKLARKVAGTSLNLNVDADVAKSTSLKLPITNAEKNDTSVSFSHALAPLPYEEWQCDDESLFALLPNAVAPITQTWPWQPVLPGFWQQAVEVQDKTKFLPERWILARRLWERQQGIENHELTMSRWCCTPFFHWLLHQFIMDRERFASIYNNELHLYRKEHRIRSVNHPVADLLVTGDLVELPFWAWPSGNLQRGRLCARTTHGKVQLISLISGKEQILPITEETVLGTQHCTGWKIRPKALITSMMFRLFLADLFVHGIGGAIYDELTDRIFARFWKTALPRFAIVTATLRLPWGHQQITSDAPRQIKQKLRSLYWNPDIYVTTSMSPDAQRWKEQKQAILAHEALPEELSERHRQLQDIRTHLQPLVQPQETILTASLHETLQQLKRDEHHFSREHPWVLYPEWMLQKLIASFGD